MNATISDQETMQSMASAPELEMVRAEPLFVDRDLPLVVRPAVPGASVAAWAASHGDLISSYLLKHGGILLRGFGLATTVDFEAALRAIAGELLEYRERSSPRSAVGEKVYTSTDYPPDQPIFLHNENSYQMTWPKRIYFFCATPPSTGGETPIADTRRVYARIDPEIRERFESKGWTYVRNFGDGMGLPWQTVFQTQSREKVEEHCRNNGIEVEWKDGGRLRTRARRRVAARHSESGDMTWFNHATFFHVSTLAEPYREALLEEFAEEDLPANTYYGDGTPIEAEVLEHLRAAYQAEAVSFPWELGDLLILDNMLVAHGRAPYAGPRKILVGMSHPCSWSDQGS
jgi:alpha-ketoglutarate-dependent taurine dioxygenase